jgi:hypothetical protein
MVETSDAIEMPQTAPKAPSQGASEPQGPVVDSPPTSPSHPGPASPASPWWTAPGGKAVDIPAFGRGLLDQILAILFPAQPRLIPLRVRARR